MDSQTPHQVAEAPPSLWEGTPLQSLQLPETSGGHPALHDPTPIFACRDSGSQTLAPLQPTDSNKPSGVASASLEAGSRLVRARPDASTGSSHWSLDSAYRRKGCSGPVIGLAPSEEFKKLRAWQTNFQTQGQNPTPHSSVSIPHPLPNEPRSPSAVLPCGTGASSLTFPRRMPHSAQTYRSRPSEPPSVSVGSRTAAGGRNTFPQAERRSTGGLCGILKKRKGMMEAEPPITAALTEAEVSRITQENTRTNRITERSQFVTPVKLPEARKRRRPAYICRRSGKGRGWSPGPARSSRRARVNDFNPPASVPKCPTPPEDSEYLDALIDESRLLDLEPESESVFVSRGAGGEQRSVSSGPCSEVMQAERMTKEEEEEAEVAFYAQMAEEVEEEELRQQREEGWDVGMMDNGEETAPVFVSPQCQISPVSMHCEGRFVSPSLCFSPHPHADQNVDGEGDEAFEEYEGVDDWAASWEDEEEEEHDRWEGMKVRKGGGPFEGRDQFAESYTLVQEPEPCHPPVPQTHYHLTVSQENHNPKSAVPLQPLPLPQSHSHQPSRLSPVHSSQTELLGFDNARGQVCAGTSMRGSAFIGKSQEERCDTKKGVREDIRDKKRNTHDEFPCREQRGEGHHYLSAVPPSHPSLTSPTPPTYFSLSATQFLHQTDPQAFLSAPNSPPVFPRKPASTFPASRQPLSPCPGFNHIAPHTVPLPCRTAPQSASLSQEGAPTVHRAPLPSTYGRNLRFRAAGSSKVVEAPSLQYTRQEQQQQKCLLQYEDKNAARALQEGGRLSPLSVDQTEREGCLCAPFSLQAHSQPLPEKVSGRVGQRNETFVSAGGVEECEDEKENADRFLVARESGGEEVGARLWEFAKGVRPFPEMENPSRRAFGQNGEQSEYDHSSLSNPLRAMYSPNSKGTQCSPCLSFRGGVVKDGGAPDRRGGEEEEEDDSESETALAVKRPFSFSAHSC
uniref:Uncharacterized protein n=1 Tax=Chromera velia CCMP2878 TaxID=1169474 RepID=A0A0G4I7Q6_9ALVE|eukprot:Cvel_11752.t1-p1 / transcript=Cvel_11752.t1 / gene=Cvel_11752 / organism=Chromera_velia_CCMP2878 / gene_product=hypothetical protein / transcript_product=hypothetical protein / location=Cvel_scaffold747:2268-6100(-) / protein_length=962 / sequence_SO=supercontig / SO=protein_coding / is_pseudo=false